MRPLRSLLTPALLAVSLFLASPAFAHTDGDSARSRPGDFIINRPANLYSRPSADSRILRELRPNTMVTVVEVRDQFYKVRSTSGKEDGFIRRSYADPYFRGGGGNAGGGNGERRRFKIGIFKLTDSVVVHEDPDSGSRRITTLRAGAEVRVVDKDRSGLWYRIESEAGNRPPGWIPTQAARRLGDVR